VVRRLAELEALVEPWEALAREAVDPNVYYEPSVLRPALQLLQDGRTFCLVFLFTPDPRRLDGPPLCIGMAPFVRESRYRGLPATVLRLARPLYNRLCTPLVHREYVGEAVTALLDWLAQDGDGAALAEFRFIAGEGRVAQELHQQLTDRRWQLLQTENTIRALFKPMVSADAYLEQSLRGKRRKELRRQENRLREQGAFEYRLLRAGDDATPWIAAFLELEARGWKGVEGSALAARDATRTFFEHAARDLHARGQLMMLGLFLDGRAIALKCNFVAATGSGAFAFKIAYDEQFVRYSPGMQLELENVRRSHEMPGLAWMDSTADAEHFMINRLWTDRRTVETLLVSPGRGWGNAVVAGVPLLRWLKTALRPGPTLPTPTPTPTETT
jgi:CelD/BcsL family acetyltransferase involved in cellulose biosynthesis